MKVLVINAGSSSLKYQLLDPETGHLLAKGLCERIGIDGKFTYKPQVEGKAAVSAADVPMPTHSEAIQAVLSALVDPDNGVISSMKEIDAVGHRVVHGGEKFAKSVLITDVSDYRLEKARECGVDFTCNTKHNDFGEAMVNAFGPDKADVIYDCAGNDITMGQAIKYARKGSTIILVAVYAGMANVDLAVLNDHELDLNTTMMYRHEDYVEAIRLVQEGKIHLRPLMSKTFKFEDYLAAYQYIDANRETTTKVLIDVQA